MKMVGRVVDRQSISLTVHRKPSARNTVGHTAYDSTKIARVALILFQSIITQNNITLDARTIRYAERTKCGTKGNYITGENAVIQSQGLHGKIVLGIAKELTRGI